MDITGTPMRSLVFVNPDGYKTNADLVKWIERGFAFTSTLPKKIKTKKSR